MRRVKFRLRSLFAVMFLACCVCGGARVWFNKQRSDWDSEQQSVLTIQSLGGTAYTRTTAPKWLMLGFSGSKYLERIERVWLPLRTNSSVPPYTSVVEKSLGSFTYLEGVLVSGNSTDSFFPGPSVLDCQALQDKFPSIYVAVALH